MTKSPYFFQPGDCSDRTYAAARDSKSPIAAALRAETEDLWLQFAPLADSLFLEQAKVHFLQRYWEMYLAVALLRRGMPVRKAGDAGPDFYFDHDGKRFWIEAVAPLAGAGADAVPPEDQWPAAEVPTAKILLRFTAALAEKKAKYESALRAGLVGNDDGYLVAINSRGIPGGPLGNMLPFYLQAVFPIGHRVLRFNSETGEVIDRYFDHRPSVPKISQAQVSTRAFLMPEYSFCTAVVHSAVEFANHPAELGADFSVAHNPGARQSVGLSLFSWCEQWQHCGDHVRRHKAASDDLASSNGA